MWGERPLRIATLLTLAACGRLSYGPHGDASARDARVLDGETSSDRGVAGDAPSPADGDVLPDGGRELDLVVWLPMDVPPTDGVVLDASGNALHGTCTSCPAHLAVGAVGGAHAFDGTNAIRLPPSALLRIQNALTIAVWWRPTSSSAGSALVARPYAGATMNVNSWALFHMADEYLLFETEHELGDDGMYSTDTLPLDRWVHCAVTLDDVGIKRIYIDGSDSGLASSTGPVLIVDADDVFVGADVNDGAVSNQAVGALDDVRIYSRTLTSLEVAALASAGSGG